MMKYFNSILSLVFILFLIAFPLTAQEAEEEEVVQEEAVVEEEAAVEEEAVPVEAIEEEVIEEAVEEVVEEEAVEEMVMEEEDIEETALEEEFEIEGGLAGFTAGVNIGWPVITGAYLEGASTTGPNIGLIVGTPYGFYLGPFNIGVGAEILSYSWGDYYSGIALLGTINTALNDLLPFELPGILAVQIGGGYFGAGLGTTIGGSFDYQVPTIPLLVRAYARGNATTAAGGEDIADEPTGWINVGLMLNYDISTLF